MDAKLKGNLALSVAVFIWSGWMIQTRFLSLGSLGPFDLTALRFSFAALCLLPVTMKHGLVFKDGTVLKSLLLAGTLGLPYVLLVSSGMKYAPASHGASIVNGAMVVASVFASFLLLADRPKISKIIGLLTILCGLLILTLFRVESFNRGHFLFMLGGVLWGVYSVLVKKWKVDPLHATAIVGTYSAIIYIPFYLIFLRSSSSLAPESLFFHGLYQGVLASVVALFFFSYGVKTLGASKASFYMPIVPVLTTIFAALLLREIPSKAETVAIGFIVIGFVMTVGTFRIPFKSKERFA